MKLAEVQVQSLDALAKDVERRIAAGDLARADGLAARSEVLAARLGIGGRATAPAGGRDALARADGG